MTGVLLTKDAASRTASVVKDVERARRAVPRSFRAELVPVRQRLGVIVENGPNGEDDYLDERYWVHRAFLGDASGDRNARVEVSPYTTDAPGFGIRTVTNLAEREAGTHTLAVGTPVLMTNFATQGVQVRLWVMNVGGSGIAIRYAILRGVSIIRPMLEVAMVTLTDDPEVIEVEDENKFVRGEAGIPVSWYEPLIWAGAPSLQTPFLKVTNTDGFTVAWQSIKFPLVHPPDPQEFPPGGCHLLGV